MSESEEFLATSLNNVKGLVDVNKVVGTPIISENGRIIIPVTEVKLCFLSGGGEYGKENPYPFGGATGGNVIMRPTGFLVIDKDEVKTISFDKRTVLENMLFDDLPALFKKMLNK